MCRNQQGLPQARGQHEGLRRGPAGQEGPWLCVQAGWVCLGRHFREELIEWMPWDRVWLWEWAWALKCPNSSDLGKASELPGMQNMGYPPQVWCSHLYPDPGALKFTGQTYRGEVTPKGGVRGTVLGGGCRHPPILQPLPESCCRLYTL